MNAIAELSTRLDLGQLVTIQTGLALFASLGIHPAYNLPILVFGLWAHAQEDLPEQLKRFILVLAVTIVFDIMWVWVHYHSTAGFPFWTGMLTIFGLCLKPLTVINAVKALQHRGIALEDDEATAGFAGASSFAAQQSLGSPIASPDQRSRSASASPRG